MIHTRIIKEPSRKLIIKDLGERPATLKGEVWEKGERVIQFSCNGRTQEFLVSVALLNMNGGVGGPLYKGYIWAGAESVGAFDKEVERWILQYAKPAAEEHKHDVG